MPYILIFSYLNLKKIFFKDKHKQVLHAGLTLTTLNPAYTPHELAHQVTLHQTLCGQKIQNNKYKKYKNTRSHSDHSESS